MTDFVVDIETLGPPADDPLWTRLADQQFSEASYKGAPRTWKDPEKIAAHEQAYLDELGQKREEARKGQALNGLLGRIACIGIARRVRGEWHNDVLHPPVDAPRSWGTLDAERQLLYQLSRVIGTDTPRWIGWNVMFDIRFLRQRALYHREYDLLRTFGALDAKPWEAPMIDAQQLFPGRSVFGSGKFGPRLGHAWQAVTGNVDPDDTGGGSQVAQMLLEGRTQDIIDHADHDISKTIELFELLTPALRGGN